MEKNRDAKSSLLDSVTCDGHLYRLVLRSHLFWMLVEDSFRKEVTFTATIADRWQWCLRWLQPTIEPLVHYFGRATINRLTPTESLLESGIDYHRDRIKSAIQFLGESSSSPTRRIFFALSEVRHARLALLVLLERIERATELRFPFEAWSQEDAREAGDFEQELHSFYEKAVASQGAVDQSSACHHARLLYLALYHTAAFDGQIAVSYYEPTRELHRQLLETIPPGVIRECVRGRLEVLGAIHPASFEASALKLSRENQP